MEEHSSHCSCAIRNLIARYTDGVNIRDKEVIADCYALDAVWDIKNFAYAEGRDQIVNAIFEGFKSVDWLIQYLHSTRIITQTPDHAITRSYLTEYGPRDGVPTVFLGSYQDECIRDTDGTWRFKRRTFDIVYAGPPDMSGAPALPFPNRYPDQAS